jgi:[ribosomal protein S18]-alanine N-acetyltransferase
MSLVRCCVPMHITDMEAVMALEKQAAVVPWSLANFVDSLAAGHCMWLLQNGQHQALIGYLVAMRGAHEMHLLNITVAPALEGLGHGRYLLDQLVAHCRAVHLSQVWLEVRQSNVRAQQLYLRYGFTQVGLRRSYYPTPEHVPGREDAVVMTLDIAKNMERNLVNAHGLE